jgi:uncharacterized protein
MHPVIVLSHFQAKALLAARAANRPGLEVSLDLGRTTAVLPLQPDYILLPDGQRLTWDQLAEIASNELACYLVADSEIEKIHFFSEYQNRYYSLMPTTGAPTMLISGIPMHRIKGTDPHRDTLSKIKALSPITGQVLDTTMGLGYTAIEAAKTAEHVTTLELDPTVLEICRRNPWSQGLFNNPKITITLGDAYEEIERFDDRSFSRILHDPPMFSLAGDLYSADFYRQLLRVLKAKGRLFHYIGDPKSKSGAAVTRGAVRRLQEAGFHRIVPQPQAFGVVAYKG